MLGKKANPHIPIHMRHPWFNIRIRTMIGIPCLVPFARRIHHQVRTQIEQIAHVQLVVNDAASLCLLLADDLANILVDEISLLQRVFREEPPSRLLDARFGNEQMTMPPHADVIVATSLAGPRGGRVGRIVASPASPTQVRIALALGGVAGAGVRAALSGLALAPAKEVGRSVRPAAGLGAEEAVGDAAAGAVVAGFVVIAGEEGGEDDLALDVT
mmetsp:Transcript_12177/g.21106  ORF Transcript_12177/g.21106 Transcript_12177/m.21106 type:complete len:215 (-) Transcript_12177:24-668(-)